MGLLILASFQANSHTPYEFLHSFRPAAPTTAATLQCCMSSPPAAAASARSRRRQHSLRPSVFSCSFLTITTSVGRLGHAAHAQVPPIPCLSTPAGQARAIATQVLRDAAIRRLELKGKILGGRRHLPPKQCDVGRSIMTRSNKEVGDNRTRRDGSSTCRRIIYILYIMTVSLSNCSVLRCIKNIAPVRVVIVGYWSY